jgi:hypothetical protein
MSKPLSNRLEKLELATEESAGENRDYHIIHAITNPDGSLHEELHSIIENGVAIRDDCGRALGWRS